MVSGRVLFAVVLTSVASPVIADAENKMLTLLEQTDGLPEEFTQYFFDLPLSARITLNGEFLGDAMIMLSRNNTVKVLSFSNNGGSQFGEEERQRWQKNLASPVMLGNCNTDCPGGLIALRYTLSSASLDLITHHAVSTDAVKWHSDPAGGSHGLIVRNRLNAYGSRGDQLAGRAEVNARASAGNWTLNSGMQFDRGGERNAQINHRVTDLYASREAKGHYLQAGYFTPDSSGLLRQPRTNGRSVQTLAGFAMGSSDTRLDETPRASVYPVYVTANREGSVEVWRDGVMIFSQPVSPGLQLVKTERLPSGIYPVELRVIEDGRVVSTSDDLIYKPNDWRVPGQRVRYYLYGGQQESLWDTTPNPQRGKVAVGTGLNVLLHPRVTGGLAVGKVGDDNQAGVSMDWQAAERLRFYGNYFHSGKSGNGFDIQSSMQFNATSLSLNHSRSWREYPESEFVRHYQARMEHNSGISVSHRLNGGDSLSLRASHRSNTPGMGLDLAYTTRRSLFNTDVRLQFSAFDRPYGNGDDQRNRGFGITASFDLSPGRRNLNASIGSRNDNKGRRENYGSLSLSQTNENGPFKQVSGTLLGDAQGLGLSGYSNFESQYVSGDFYGQRSSQGFLSGGINAESTIAVGKGAFVASGVRIYDQNQSGVIIDLESDDPSLTLSASDSQGGSTTLRAGKNFVPVTAHRAGQVRVGFVSGETPALKVNPEVIDYHVNKGGVLHQKVQVMKTVTVLGRIMDAKGSPLAGAHVINHAGQSVSESDGFFTLEMSENMPMMKVEHQNANCEIHLPDTARRREGDTLLAGNLICVNGTPSAQENTLAKN